MSHPCSLWYSVRVFSSLYCIRRSGLCFCRFWWGVVIDWRVLWPERTRILLNLSWNWIVLEMRRVIMAVLSEVWIERTSVIIWTCSFSELLALAELVDNVGWQLLLVIWVCALLLLEVTCAVLGLFWYARVLLGNIHMRIAEWVGYRGSWAVYAADLFVLLFCTGLAIAEVTLNFIRFHGALLILWFLALSPVCIFPSQCCGFVKQSSRSLTVNWSTGQLRSRWK